MCQKTEPKHKNLFFKFPSSQSHRAAIVEDQRAWHTPASHQEPAQCWEQQQEAANSETQDHAMVNPDNGSHP